MLIGHTIKEETSNVQRLEHSLVWCETWTLGEVDHKYLENFAMWCWRRMEKTSWTDRVSNEIVLHRGKEERSILHTAERKGNWTGHSLCWNCLLKHVIEGKYKLAGRGRRKRRRQLMNDVKEKRGYWILNEETLDRTVWRTHCGRGCGSVARRTTE